MNFLKKIAIALRPLVDKFPVVARIYRYLRDLKDFSSKPKDTSMGFRFAGNETMASGFYEPIETELVKKLLCKTEVFINVGANIGYYCCHALCLGKYTIAFEPIRKNVDCLCKNVAENGWSSMIEIFPMALTNKATILKIFGGGTGASIIRGWSGVSENYFSLIPANTIDAVLGSRFAGKCCFILVDIEGAEKLMLEGATILLAAEPKPIWLVEISIDEHQPEKNTINPNLIDTFNIFWRNGYDAWTAEQACRYVSPDEVRAVSESGMNSFGTHNFIFTSSTYGKEIIKWLN